MDLDDRIVALVRHYMTLYGLGDWDISIVTGDYTDGYAGVETWWYYQQAKFHFDLDAIREKMADSDNPEAFLLELCRHEVTHCALAALADGAEALAKDHGKGAEEIIEMLHEASTNVLSRAPFWDSLPKG